MNTLHIHDRGASAATFLLWNSALTGKIEEGELTLEVKSARYVTVTADHRFWSDGEKALWHVLNNFTSSAPGLNVQRLAWLDDQNRAAVHTALGVHLGVVVAVPVVGTAS